MLGKIAYFKSFISFELPELLEAVKVTFERRKTTVSEEPIVFRSGFIKSYLKQEQWSNFCRLNGLNTRLEFEQIVLKLGIFLKPLFYALQLPVAVFLQWVPEFMGLEKINSIKILGLCMIA
jgi:hypothetical protein